MAASSSSLLCASSFLITSHPSSSNTRQLSIPSTLSSAFSSYPPGSRLSQLGRSWKSIHGSPASSLPSLRVMASADKKKVLIVNTNSGGHAVIGFYFAKELLSYGHDVTVLTVGEESSDKMKKPPFSRFSVRPSFKIIATSWFNRMPSLKLERLSRWACMFY